MIFDTYLIFDPLTRSPIMKIFENLFHKRFTKQKGSLTLPKRVIILWAFRSLKIYCWQIAFTEEFDEWRLNCDSFSLSRLTSNLSSFKCNAKFASLDYFFESSADLHGISYTKVRDWKNAWLSVYLYTSLWKISIRYCTMFGFGFKRK